MGRRVLPRHRRARVRSRRLGRAAVLPAGAAHGAGLGRGVRRQRRRRAARRRQRLGAPVRRPAVPAGAAARPATSARAVRAAWFAAIFPPAVALVLGYAEATFMLLSVAMFLALRARSIRLGGRRSACSPGLTRPVGVLLAIPAAIEAARGWRGASARDRVAAGRRGARGSGRQRPLSAVGALRLRRRLAPAPASRTIAPTGAGSSTRSPGRSTASATSSTATGSDRACTSCGRPCSSC